MTTDAERLTALLAGVQSLANFARDYKVPGGPSMISQHKSGHRPISLEAAIAYAAGLRVPIEKVSPAAAKTLRAAALSRPRQAALPPSLPDALPVVLDALAASPHRAELRSLLALLVDTDAPAYRARLAELLVDGAPGKHRNAA